MNIVRDILHVTGVNPRYRGYWYLACAIELAAEGGPKGLQLTKTVYPAVAERFHTTWSCVERDIRTAVTKAWESGGRERFCALTGYCAQIRPTSGQFIMLLADKLRMLAADGRSGG